jgi:mannose-6-phosphate isomerase-like protein (cupin superfamily)
MTNAPNPIPGGTRRIAVAEALARLHTAGGKPFATVFERADLIVEIYAPLGVDLQTPHTRDELYFVVKGKGVFVNGENREPFAPGDLLFAAAGLEHRFEGFTDDLVVWVVFFGSEGGEKQNSEVRSQKSKVRR